MGKRGTVEREKNGGEETAQRVSEIIERNSVRKKLCIILCRIRVCEKLWSESGRFMRVGNPDKEEGKPVNPELAREQNLYLGKFSFLLCSS
ncbi:hypothetical protein COLO4_24497 [Corchorus olitorius]|uniref:Uncharacterized protein n=1 Tax=Corchorus olitorius TaxID=93759 RepID=A0A1R3I9I3_9ROSI|nr:hypothetical protein COLO4_24497 [Corchorus olitorius]